MKKLTIDWEVYIREADVPKQTEQAPKLKGMKFVMVRTYSAWVFFGYLAEQKGQEVTLKNARRVYYWDGAATLSQLATEWTSKPKTCKFPCTVEEIQLLQAIEIIPITAKAKESLESVAIWKE